MLTRRIVVRWWSARYKDIDLPADEIVDKFWDARKTVVRDVLDPWPDFIHRDAIPRRKLDLYDGRKDRFRDRVSVSAQQIVSGWPRPLRSTISTVSSATPRSDMTSGCMGREPFGYDIRWHVLILQRPGLERSIQ